MFDLHTHMRSPKITLHILLSSNYLCKLAKAARSIGESDERAAWAGCRFAPNWKCEQGATSLPATLVSWTRSRKLMRATRGTGACHRSIFNVVPVVAAALLSRSILPQTIRRVFCAHGLVDGRRLGGTRLTANSPVCLPRTTKFPT